MTVESYKCYDFYEDGVFLEYNDEDHRAEFARYGRINEDNEKEYIEVGKTELEALIEQYKQYEKIKQSRDKIIKKSKKRITGYNMKDIYYSLRPKGKNSNKTNDDYRRRWNSIFSNKRFGNIFRISNI